jgi:hypothetical protein
VPGELRNLDTEAHKDIATDEKCRLSKLWGFWEHPVLDLQIIRQGPRIRVMRWVSDLGKSSVCRAL